MSTTSSSRDGTAGAGDVGHRKGHVRQESMYAMTGLYSESVPNDTGEDATASASTGTGTVSGAGAGTGSGSVKCHSRNPSSSLVAERSRAACPEPDPILLLTDSKDCGILSCRPAFIQKFSGIKVFTALYGETRLRRN